MSSSTILEHTFAMGDEPHIGRSVFMRLVLDHDILDYLTVGMLDLGRRGQGNRSMIGRGLLVSRTQFVSEQITFREQQTKRFRSRH
jgi:hypothetical protein